MTVAGLVSVVVPAYNREGFLRDAVESALRQTYPHREVVIVDDGSTDATLQVALELAKLDPGRIKVARQTNAGPGVARNHGLSLAAGEFIQYLDSDDLLEPRKLELQVGALRENPEAGVAYGLTRRIDMRTGKSSDWARTGEDIADIFPSFLIKRGWDTNSPLWRRTVCDAVGPWGAFRCMEDWEHDLRAGLLGVRPVRVTAHVCTVRDHKGERASGAVSGFTPELTREFFLAHKEIWRKMQQSAGASGPHMHEFSRKLFWIARLCGERGLVAEADEALGMAKTMSESNWSAKDMVAVGALVRLVGWQRTVAIGERIRRLVVRR